MVLRAFMQLSCHAGKGGTGKAALCQLEQLLPIQRATSILLLFLAPWRFRVVFHPGGSASPALVLRAADARSRARCRGNGLRRRASPPRPTVAASRLRAPRTRATAA